MNNHHDSLRAIIWNNDVLELLDQRVLPHETRYLSLRTPEEIANAIKDMVVRGAPAIGITAAFGVVLAARHAVAQDQNNWKSLIKKDFQLLAASRPTAVNLFWALAKMQQVVDNLENYDDAALLNEAQRIHDVDIADNYRMGELGAAFIEPNSNVLTHCNTGSLATGGYGTALGVIRSAYRAGNISQVFADETRPWMQGSRLTAWELVQDQIPVTLIVEGAAASLMRDKSIRWVIVGADRITANGDVANKIGTYNLAVLSKYHGVKFMVVAPTSTIDMNLANGEMIPIEQRAPSEIFQIKGQQISANGANAWNPAFDVTPASLIDVIVTERGVVQNPTLEKMQALFI
jgi:methylthioribose-1-phosphate isomerase